MSVDLYLGLYPIGWPGVCWRSRTQNREDEHALPVLHLTLTIVRPGHLLRLVVWCEAPASKSSYRSRLAGLDPARTELRRFARIRSIEFGDGECSQPALRRVEPGEPVQFDVPSAANDHWWWLHSMQPDQMLAGEHAQPV